ncbi:Hsp70 family protein [Dactylosporangium sp. McL0621]|uniref:Hsp70 family protein n=1 Tax=Dactylosporangium sp. McL0621 TaxID=3415678 RepID=UPI003CF3B036
MPGPQPLRGRAHPHRGRRAQVVGGPVASVAITHPAHWHRPQTQVLERAAALVGLRPLRLVPEPAAAALHADEVGALGLPDGTAAVVLDLGAGSVDAAVVQRTGRTVSVLSSRSPTRSCSCAARWTWPRRT